MSTFVTDGDGEHGADDAGRPAGGPLTVVLGYDGSEPAKRALDRAMGLLDNRAGVLEVVYVSHVPSAAAISAEAIAEVEDSLDVVARDLEDEVRTRLEGLDLHWHFQRRKGPAAHELTLVADELGKGDENADIVIVVGGSESWYHHLAGAVGAHLARDDRFPVVVVP